MIQFIFIFIIPIFIYGFYLRRYGNKNKTITQEGINSLKSNWKWIDDSGFQCLTMICDTFAPSCSINDIDQEDIVKKLEILSDKFNSFIYVTENLFPTSGTSTPTSSSSSPLTSSNSLNSILKEKTFSTFLNTSNIKKNKNFLTLGCLKFNTHINFAETIEIMCTSVDKMKLYVLLSLLNSSFGCFILVGLPCPFTKLSLYHRELALQRLRDHFIVDLKGSFSILKKLIGTLYLSYTERYTKNYLWQSMKYNDSFLTAINPKAAEKKLKLHEIVYVKEDLSNNFNQNCNMNDEKKNNDEQDEISDNYDLLSIKSDDTPKKAMTRDELLREKLTFPNILKEISYYNYIKSNSTASSSSSPTSNPSSSPISPSVPFSAPSISNNSSHILYIDAVVVGSGAGGGVVANTLIEAGYDVIVLEKGGYFNAIDFSQWNESEAMANTFEKGGIQSTDDGNILVLSGACVGGGTTINWSASFPPPPHIRNEWLNRFGLKDFNENSKYDKSLEYVSKKLNVNTDYSYYDIEEINDKKNFIVNSNNRFLWNGAKSLNYSPQKIPRNVKKCTDCGHCNKGCSYESKNSTFDAFLMDHIIDQYRDECNVTSDSAPCTDSTASECNPSEKKKKGRLYVLPDCSVTRVLTQGSPLRAIGVEAIVKIYEPNPYNRKNSKDPRNPSEYNNYFPNESETPLNPPQGEGLIRNLISSHYLQIKSRVVVSSCGSIHTPALLLRSNLKNDNIGRYLTLHPVVGVAGIFPIWEDLKKLKEDEDKKEEDEKSGEENKVEKTSEDIVKFFHDNFLDGRAGLSNGTSMGVVIHKRKNATKSKKYIKVDKNEEKTPKIEESPSYNYKDDNNYPYVLETPPVHSGLLGLLLPWDNGISYKLATTSYSNLAAFLVIQRDRDNRDNRVVLSPSLPQNWRGNTNNKSLAMNPSKNIINIISPHRNSTSSSTSSPLLLSDPNDWGQPVIHYRISKEDETSLTHGLIEALKMLRAAGALMSFPGHNGCFPWYVETDKTQVNQQLLSSYQYAVKNPNSSEKETISSVESTKITQEIQSLSDKEFEKYLNLIKKTKISSLFSISCFSAHQMSSCRMHTSPLYGVLTSKGRTHECLGLYVADGSSLPTSVGVNPMLTIESVAHLISTYIVEDLDSNEYLLEI